MRVLHALRRRPFVAAGVGVPLLLALSFLWPIPEAARRPGGVVSVRVTDGAGVLLRELRSDGRGEPVRLDDVPDFAIRALVATEDRRFHHHVGVDARSLGRAMRDAILQRRATSGASTLTMQVARGLRGERERGVWSKLAEMHLALRLDARLGKAEILELWLSRAPFGAGAYGLEAAARTYFGKRARDLTPGEAALLVGLPQSPSRYNPHRHPDRALARRRTVLAASVRADVLTAAAAREIEATPLALAPLRPRADAMHLTERLRGALPPGTREVRTTLDARLQTTVEALARTHLARLEASGAQNAAALVIDNRTGDVLAYAGSADYHDAAAGGASDGVRMLRQPGSALKPFTYAHALATRRYTPASILPDVELLVPEAGGAFRPQNYDRTFHGPVPLRTALASSYNVPAVYLAREIGPAALLRTMRAAGFASLDRPAEVYGVGLTLGNGEVRLEELAAAYAALARGGSRPALRTVRWTRSASGDTLAPPAAPDAPTGVTPAVAHLVTRILADADARAPGFGRGGPLELPFPAAVKTGTSKDYRDNWAVGYTPRHTVAVWVGRFDGRPMQRVSGVSGAGPLLHGIFLELGGGGGFAAPGGIAFGPVCPHSGHAPGRACPGARVEAFLAGTVPADTCRVHRLVTVDARTGLLADASTPRAAVRVRRFADHGPVFHAWMRARGLPLPPRVTLAESARGGAARFSDRLAVEYPASGARFLVDPHLRAAYQRLPLRARAEAGLAAPAWVIDGRAAGRGFTLDWPLAPGRHTAEVHAVDETGARVRSRPVAFTVE